MPTKIEWCEETWNPVTGCTPVSEGCTNCYAARMARRLAGRYGYPEGDGFKVALHPDRLEQPLKWRKPRRVFVCSMGDLFHPDVPFYFVCKIMAIAAACPQHKFIFLTKRVVEMRDYFTASPPLEFQLPEAAAELGVLDRIPGKHTSWPPPNVWLGVTAENQARADERIPVLLSIPAAVHFVSIEPCLGPVDMDKYLSVEWYAGEEKPLNAIPTGLTYRPARIRRALSWVILGAETGPGRRAMLPRWARDVKDQCVEAGAAFFLKQMYNDDGKLIKLPELDGRTWAEYPE